MFARMLHPRILAYWARAARLVPDLPFGDLRLLRADAAGLRLALDRAVRGIDGRLARPLSGDGITRPWGCDWAWRPEAWSMPLPALTLAGGESRLGTEITVFHDAAAPQAMVRPVAPSGPAACGIVCDVYGFDGSFLSLVLDLPDAGMAGLRRHHLLRLSARIVTERPMRIFSRLNIRHGPNTEQILRELPDGPERSVDFDLAYTRMNERRIEKLWIDLIFEAPGMNRIAIEDLTFLRHPRADI